MYEMECDDRQLINDAEEMLDQRLQRIDDIINNIKIAAKNGDNDYLNRVAMLIVDQIDDYSIRKELF